MENYISTEKIEGTVDKLSTTEKIDKKVKELKLGLNIRELDDRRKMGMINDLSDDIKSGVNSLNEDIVAKVNEKLSNKDISPEDEIKLDNELKVLSQELDNKINDYFANLDKTLNDDNVYSELLDIKRDNENLTNILDGLKYYEKERVQPKLAKAEATVKELSLRDKFTDFMSNGLFRGTKERTKLTDQVIAGNYGENEIPGRVKY